MYTCDDNVLSSKVHTEGIVVELLLCSLVGRLGVVKVAAPEPNKVAITHLVRIILFFCIMEIIYASQTGNSEFYSKVLARMLYERGLEVSVSSVEDCSILSLVEKERQMIFVCSTTGQGTVPSAMKRFWSELLRVNMPPLPKLSYTVFGLGDSSYEHYNFASKKLYRRLEQLGAKTICVRGEGDEQSACGIDDGFYAWFENLCLALDLSTVVRPIMGPTVGVGMIQDRCSITFIERGNYKGRVLSNERITHAEHFQDTRLISVAMESKVTYDAGDVAVIYPRNSPGSVSLFCSRLKWDASWVLELSQIYPFAPVESDTPLTLGVLLTEYFDLLGPPNRSFFSTLSKFAKDEVQRQKLREIASPEGYDIYLDYCVRPRRTPLEILEDFGSVETVPIEYLFDLLPPMKPRSFSIASYSTEKVELCVALVKYKHRLIRMERVGLFSEYIREQLLPGSIICLSIVKGDICVPPDAPVPLVFMASGTGIAPMRALIQKYGMERKAYLFFGCRSVDKDFYFCEEWKGYSNLQVFAKGSRDQGEKIYLQDIIRGQAELVYKLVVEAGAVLVLAGNTKLSPAVKGALCEVFMEQGGFTKDLAKMFIERLCKQGRFQIECW